jgi:hypothetical protein
MATTDLVHDPEEYRVPLQPFRFLLGDFRGEGRYTHGDNVFQKELNGSWEANGRFLGLRMRVTYLLSDGRKDIHEALVLIGAHSTLGPFEAHAYTDSGAIQHYQLELNGETISFADRPPTEHDSKIQRARKSLTPTPDGFEERVDVDRGDGTYTFYSIVRMQRIEFA